MNIVWPLHSSFFSQEWPQIIEPTLLWKQNAPLLVFQHWYFWFRISAILFFYIETAQFVQYKLRLGIADKWWHISHWKMNKCFSLCSIIVLSEKTGDWHLALPYNLVSVTVSLWHGLLLQRSFQLLWKAGFLFWNILFLFEFWIYLYMFPEPV